MKLPFFAHPALDFRLELYQCIYHLCDAPGPIRSGLGFGEVHDTIKVRVLWILNGGEWDVWIGTGRWNRIGVWTDQGHQVQDSQLKQISMN